MGTAEKSDFQKGGASSLGVYMVIAGKAIKLLLLTTKLSFLQFLHFVRAALGIGRSPAQKLCEDRLGGPNSQLSREGRPGPTLSLFNTMLVINPLRLSCWTPAWRPEASSRTHHRPNNSCIRGSERTTFHGCGMSSETAKSLRVGIAQSSCTSPGPPQWQNHNVLRTAASANPASLHSMGKIMGLCFRVFPNFLG